MPFGQMVKTIRADRAGTTFAFHQYFTKRYAENIGMKYVRVLGYPSC